MDFTPSGRDSEPQPQVLKKLYDTQTLPYDNALVIKKVH